MKTCSEDTKRIKKSHLEQMAECTYEYVNASVEQAENAPIASLFKKFPLQKIHG